MVSNGSQIPWYISSLLLPIIVSGIGSYLAIHFKIKKEQKRRIKRAEENWLLDLLSISEKIYWECSKLPMNKNLDERTIPTPASEYGNLESVEHLDQLMEDLMDHFSHAPPEIPRELRTEVFELKKAYDNPDVENSLTTNYLRTDFRKRVEELIGHTASEADRANAAEHPL